MQIFIALALMILICNILLPKIKMKNDFESHLMNNLETRGYTNPYCYMKYLASVSRTTFGMSVKVAMTNEDFSTCTSRVTGYYECTPRDFSTLNHPCQFVFSSLPLRN
jgi:hypothetical protein